MEYPDVVAVELRRLSSGTKKRLWRARQLQNRAYNWGVEHALRLHDAGEKIPSPRVDSVPLTLLRRDPENRKGGLVLQRGGFWQGVNAAKKWSKRRRSLMWGFSLSVDKVEATAKRLAETETFLPAEAREHLAGLVENASEYASLSSALVSELEGHPDLSYASEIVEAEPVERITEKFHAPLRDPGGRTQDPGVSGAQADNRPCSQRRRSGGSEGSEERCHQACQRREEARPDYQARRAPSCRGSEAPVPFPQGLRKSLWPGVGVPRELPHNRR